MKINSRIYVAGHRGLAGSAIYRALKKAGYQNIITRSHSELELLEASEVRAFFSETKPEFIFLAAAKVGGIHANSSYPAEFIRENIVVQTNVIHEAWKHEVKKLVFLGSSRIYPKLCPQPMKEEYLLTGELEPTNDAYALAKIAGIKTCQSYNHQYGTNFISVMPTNLYGPNDNFDSKNSHFIPALIKKFVTANQKKINNIEIWGSGKPMREIMHVNDLASAIIFLLEKKVSKNKRFNKFLEKNSVINVGSSFEISIKKFAKKVAKLTNNNSKLTFNTKLPDGTKRKILDNTFMKKMGWKSKISLNKGLVDTINWFKENY